MNCLHGSHSTCVYRDISAYFMGCAVGRGTFEYQRNMLSASVSRLGYLVYKEWFEGWLNGWKRLLA